MKIVSTIEEVRAQVKEWKKEGLSIGFVPTMGYLHEGHMSLIDAAGENDRVVVSIFVNPMQFGPTEDLASYPRDLKHDAKLCEEHDVDLIFHPTPEEMYGDQFYSYVDMDVLTKELCGLSRPVHFRGVCTVVTKLFNIVTPDRAYFGQKDAQQLESTETSLRLLSESMDNSMDEVYRLVRYCQTDSNIANYIEHNPNPGSVLSVSTYDSFYEECSRNSSYNYMPRIAIVSQEHYLQVVTATYSSTADLATLIPELPYYEELLTADDYDFSPGIVSDPFHRAGRKV